MRDVRPAPQSEATRAADEPALKGPETIQELQRAVGNRGMAELARSGRLTTERVLHRQPTIGAHRGATATPPAPAPQIGQHRLPQGPGVQPLGPPTAITAFDANIAIADWEAAAVALNGAPATDITARVSRLNVFQCRHLLAALRNSTRLTAANNIEAPLKTQSGIKDGEIFGTVGEQHTPHDAAAAGGQYSFDQYIQFNPDADVVDCPEIVVIQTVRVVNTGSGANAETLPHLIRRQNTRHTSIDRIEGRQFGYYGYNNTGVASGDPGTGTRPVGGGNMRAGSAPSPLRSLHYYDGPSDSMVNVTFEFETAMVARRGPQRGLVYSVVTWGFDVRANGRLRRHAVHLKDRVSSDFLSARRHWNAQASGPAAQRNDPNQSLLPSLR